MSENNNTVIKDIIDRIVDICYYSGNILELLVCAVIASHYFRGKSSSLASAYFYILFWGYVFDAMYELGFTCQRYLTKDWDSNNIIDLPFIKTAENIMEWYIMLFLGPAMVSLSLNRFTSIFLITKHKTIWIKYFSFILTFLLIYPFIVGGFTFFTYSNCRIDIYAPECLNYFKADYYRSAISNGICAILSLIIGISTATFYKLKFANDAKAQTRQLKIEHKLLLQSVWSASLFGFFAFLGVFYPYFYEKKDDPEFFVMNRIYGFVQDLAYISYHYLSIILLFVFSPALKTEFLRFYHLLWICRRRKRPTIVPTSAYNVSFTTRRNTVPTAIIDSGNQKKNMSPQCPNHHITHVIFDYDGVIQDTEKVYFTANDAALRAFGKSFNNIMKAEIMGRCNAVEWILQTTGLAEFGVTVEKHDMIYNQVVETLLPDAPLMPGIVNLIEYLQRENIPYAICSAANETDFERKTRKLKPFIAKFPLIELVGEDRTVKHGKPAPDPYLATIKRFTVPPKSNKNVLVIEDSINGAKSGLAAGCTTIFVPQAEFKPFDFEERIACIKPKLAEILNTLEDFEPEKYGLPQM